VEPLLETLLQYTVHILRIMLNQGTVMQQYIPNNVLKFNFPDVSEPLTITPPITSKELSPTPPIDAHQRPFH
jgi:hypothetical protein